MPVAPQIERTAMKISSLLSISGVVFALAVLPAARRIQIGNG